jgi:hypothetical protein
MKIEKQHFYVLENFSGTGVDEYGNSTHRENTSIIFWSGDSEIEEINKDLIVRDATLEEKEFFWDTMQEPPNEQDYAAIGFEGFEDWKQNKNK